MMTSARRSPRRSTHRPSASAPCTWKTFLAMSRPITAGLGMSPPSNCRRDREGSRLRRPGVGRSMPSRQQKQQERPLCGLEILEKIVNVPDLGEGSAYLHDAFERGLHFGFAGADGAIDHAGERLDEFY